MNFLKDNWRILLLVILTITSEVFHLLFVNIPFYDEGINLDVPIYYLVSQIGLTTFIPSIFIFYLIPRKKIASKCIAFGLVMWNIKEVFDEIFYLQGINSNVFEVNKSFWGQIVLIITIIGLSGWGYWRWKY